MTSYHVDVRRAKTFYRGKVTRALISLNGPCGCAAAQDYLMVWRRIIPPHFQDVTLENLQPSPNSKMPIPVQQKYINTIRENSDDSFFLSGPPETGKSHLAMAILGHAIKRWASAGYCQGNLDPFSPPIWYASVPTLMRAFTGMYQREAVETKPASPAVTPDWINRVAAMGLRPVIVLDEFDKSVSTDQRKDFLFDLVNSVWLHDGQVIAISNTSYAELTKAWGENFGGGAILRRIGRGDGCHNLAFVKSK